jgi:hypothetical protein
MIFLKRTLEYAIFVGAILLAFLLAFEKYLSLPYFLSWIGHWHPLILHFPIVLIFVTVIQYWRKDPYIEWYLSFTTFLTMLTTITGFLLSIENGSKGELTLIHQWLGVSVAYLMAIWFWISKGSVDRNVAVKTLQLAMLILIVFTGHFGGMVTHGQNFLSWSVDKGDEISVLPDDPLIYEHFIREILDQKCTSCHNANKAKGELNLTDYATIIQGGESGNPLEKNNQGGTAFLYRVNLPLDHEDHMPPKDEEQLTDIELIILRDWLDGGGEEKMRFSDLEQQQKSYPIIEERIAKSKDIQWENLPEISEDKIIELRSNYITISRLFSKSNALQVIIFPHEGFKAGSLKLLKSIAENIIELDLSGLPLNQMDFQFINSLKNIEKLNVSNNTLEDSWLKEISDLQRLKELIVNNTALTEEALPFMSKLPALQKLYAFRTNIESEALHLFGEDHGIFVIDKSPQASEFRSVLPTPTIENGRSFFREPFKVLLKHPLKEIDVYYSLDEKNSSASFQKLTDSLFIDRNAKIRFYAKKEGWESSPVDSVSVFKSSVFPDNYELVYPPDSKYQGRGIDLLFNLEKGPVNFGDSAWMAFRDDPFILSCSWDQEIILQSVLISTIIQTDPYLFPPQSIIVKGGISKNEMKVLGEIKPRKLNERKETYFDYFNVSFEPSAIKFLKVEVMPLQSLPIWHQGKGQKGWVFIDEIVLSEPEVL